VVEGFGIVVLEAMACSSPYVASDIPPLREVTNNGVGGLLFEKENPKDLSQKILSLLRDDNLYNRCLHDGLELAQKYDWENIAKETEMFYEQVINEHLGTT
jgi:glycosyltransferase involved in cell wall biosynthesis